MSTLFEVIVYLTAAIIAVPISKRFGLGSVLGYLAAGILIGPFGIGIIEDADHTLHFAELGVVFLLFVIGLELQPSRLWVLRRMVFGLGSMQVILSALAITAIAALFTTKSSRLKLENTFSSSSTLLTSQVMARPFHEVSTPSITSTPTTSNPSAESRSQIARPIPLPAPVTKATLSNPPSVQTAIQLVQDNEIDSVHSFAGVEGVV